MIIALVFIYSGIFIAGNGYYMVECAHVSYYGEDCQTCGLTRSFSEMVRGNFSSASDYNRNGPLIFTFFVSQLFMRAIAGLVLHRIGRTGAGDTGVINTLSESRSGTGYSGSADLKRKALALSDATVSFVLFIVCFRNLLVFWH